ncbi:hypothetical protein B296_00008036 [Ensete ventricosum]|uniref:Uncharacterized protein n=1 Tax=Ensete ventricosum TaxID=4639 RepID=A0A427AJB5_ENSVE|nr:hypothetical protein B296_00008036 [Ensete ventricosum]
MQWELAEGQPRFGRYCQELVETSPEVCQKVCREFINRLLGVRRKDAGSSSRVCRRESGAHWGFTGRMPVVHWCWDQLALGEEGGAGVLVQSYGLPLAISRCVSSDLPDTFSKVLANARELPPHRPILGLMSKLDPGFMFDL